MVATSFARALSLTLKFEGGYSDHSRDPGGATNLGITQKTLEFFRGHPVTKADVSSLKLDEAAKIYRQNYWNAVCCDQMPAGVDICMFDLAVNSGPEKAIRILQVATGLSVNGILSAQTLAAAQHSSPHTLIKSICRLRLSFLQRLTLFATFGRGWSARIAAIEREADKLIEPATTSLTPNPKDIPMSQVKNIFQSRTIWSNIIGLGAVAVSYFGIDTISIDQPKILDSVAQIIAAGSFISSSVFRVLANRKLV